MTHIKNQAVFHCIKNGFNGHSQLHRAQIGRQMAAGLGHIVHQKITNFRAKYSPLGIIQRQQVFMTVNVL